MLELMRSPSHRCMGAGHRALWSHRQDSGKGLSVRRMAQMKQRPREAQRTLYQAGSVGTLHSATCGLNAQSQRIDPSHRLHWGVHRALPPHRQGRGMGHLSRPRQVRRASASVDYFVTTHLVKAGVQPFNVRQGEHKSGVCYEDAWVPAP